MTNDYSIDTSDPVMVTGASSYIGGWIVKRLLDAGATVHATVRNPDNVAKVAHLQEIADAAPGTLKLFKADLLEDGGFDAAMTECAVVMHVASPYQLFVKDAQRDLIGPALHGTRNVLNAVNRTDSVHRVVLTSSMAAIYADNADCADAPGGTLTEEQWNSTASLEHSPYSYSKTLAERAAWDMANEQDRWRLVVINPSGVFGPAVGGDFADAQSFKIIKQISDGTMKSGAPDIQFGAVDVQDVVEAHLRAAFLPDAEGRHVLSKETWSLFKVGQSLAKTFPDYPFPSRLVPKWLIWLVGPLANRELSRRYIAQNVGHAWKADNSKSRERLGIEYSPIEPAFDEMFSQMIDVGILPKR